MRAEDYRRVVGQAHSVRILAQMIDLSMLDQAINELAPRGTSDPEYQQLLAVRYLISLRTEVPRATEKDEGS